VFYFCFIDAKQRLSAPPALNAGVLAAIRFVWEQQK
jgi:hypothetical protein